MASKLDNVAGIFKNVKSRTVFLATIFFIILGLVVALSSLSHHASQEESVNATSLPSAPTISGNPDVLGDRATSQQRARLNKIADDTKAWNAAAQGGSALPTVVSQKTDSVAKSYNQQPLTEAEKQLDALVKGAQGQGQSSQTGNQANQSLYNSQSDQDSFDRMRSRTDRQTAMADAQQARLKSQIYTTSSSSSDADGSAQDSLSGAMASEVKQLLSSWSPTSQQYVGTGGDQTTTNQSNNTGSNNASSNAGQGGKTNAPNQTTQQKNTAPPLLKAGSIQFGILQTSVNTDEPGPIMATIETGQFRGAKLLGSIQKAGKYANGVALKFSTMTLPQYKSSLSINAFAIDPDTARTALASDTNHHYLLRYGSLFASSFLSGLSDAIGQSGKTTVFKSDGEDQEFFSDLDTNEKLLYALGNVGSEMSDEVDELFDRPTTIQIYSGTGIGILYMSDIKRPAPDQLVR